MAKENIHPISNRMVERRKKENLLELKSCVFWLCGLSGSGKSTLAIDLENRLHDQNIFSVILDGDNLRHGINSDLGFSEEDRKENIRRTSELARLLCQSGVVVIVSCITPLQSFRDSAKSIIGVSDYHEIYIKASFEECNSRDVKGLYAKAKNAEIQSFTGKDSAFELPATPNLIIDTEKESPSESSQTLFEYAQGVIQVR